MTPHMSEQNGVRLALLQGAAGLTVDEFLSQALDRVTELVQSPIGFFHFVAPDERSLQLQQWSSRTVREFCTVQGKGLHYSVDEAGVWVDCLRERRPVVHNDYASLPHKRGLPPGHAPVTRELVVPVIRNERVVAILGVGNKPVDYTDQDVSRVSYLADVTWHIVEYKQIEEAHEESEARLRLIFETMPIGWAEHGMIFDAQGRPEDYVFLAVNAAFERFTGLSRTDVVGQRVTDVIPGIREATPDLISLYGEVVSTGKEQEFELYFEPFERWYHITAFSRRSNHFVAMFEDISVRKQAELALQELNESLARSNRELEQFAYVASHDLQEPLRMVASYTQLLAKRYGQQLDDKARTYIDFAVEGATRMQGLINDLLEYSRVGANKRSYGPVDCRGLVHEVLQSLDARVKESGATVEIMDLPTVMGDRVQLGQVFLNLISNGLKFCAGTAPLVIVSARRCDEGWCFAVADNGIGIEPKFQRRIFNIFQRLHPRGEYQGSGIGLSIVKKIVEGHGGKVGVESTPGKGATFTFTIPDREEATGELL
jgi:PAS domain S-box-containing protein